MCPDPVQLEDRQEITVPEQTLRCNNLTLSLPTQIEAQ